MSTEANATPTPTAGDFLAQDDAALAEQWGLSKPAEPEPVSAPDDTIAPVVEPAPTVEDIVPTPAPLPEELEPEPDGVVDIPPLERKPITDFMVLDAEGEVEIPDLKIKFKASGKEREYDLDHVVRLAQYGFANKEREEQVAAAKVFVQEVQQEKEQIAERLQQLESFYERVLNDPNFYDEAREIFQQRNSPEAKVQQLEQQLYQQQAQQAYVREANIVNAFIQKAVVPTTERLLTTCNTVSDNELIGQWTKLTAPLLVNGRVPTARLNEVNRLLNEDLTQWAESLHLERTSERQRQQVQTQRTQQQVTQAKRQAARAIAPQGRVPGADAQKPVKFKSADEWLSAAFGSTDNED